MKTLMLFNTFNEAPVFFELNGDYSRLDGVTIGACAPGTKDLEWDSAECKQVQAAYEQKGDELNELVYHSESGEYILTPLKQPTKDWDVFVMCGIAP